MEVISGTTQFHMDSYSAVCIGKFDGVHIGHRKLISKITEKKSEGMRAVVFTFDPSPEELFTGKKSGSLCSKEEKEAYLEDLGVDVVIEFPLTFESAAMEAEDFVRKILIDGLNMKYIVAGDDISFGAGGRGDRKLIEQMSTQYGFRCDIINKVMVDGEEVSSSRIREAIRKGKVNEAYRMLGRIGR